MTKFDMLEHLWRRLVLTYPPTLSLKSKWIWNVCLKNTMHACSVVDQELYTSVGRSSSTHCAKKYIDIGPSCVEMVCLSERIKGRFWNFHELLWTYDNSLETCITNKMELLNALFATPGGGKIHLVKKVSYVCECATSVYSHGAVKQRTL